LAISPTHSLGPKVEQQVPPLRSPDFIRVRYGRDDKFKGGSSPWHGRRWMDRVER